MTFNSAFAAVVFGILSMAGCGGVPVVDDGVSIAYLQRAMPEASLTLEKTLATTQDYQSTLMSFEAGGLKQYALMLKPVDVAGPRGHPVVIYAHGFHPEPKKYCKRVATGEDARPGDYYRGVPERYAEHGYIVLAPDYRGHNVSQGYEFTQRSFLATSYYAIDVLNLLAAVSKLPGVDADRIFLASHSMGGDVALKVLLATDRIRAASLWSPVVATTEQQALYYGKSGDEEKDTVDKNVMTSYLSKIEGVYAQLPVPVTYRDVDPVNHLDSLNTPVIVQHARGDQSVPYVWSEAFVSQLHQKNKPYVLHTYASDNHLFADQNLDLAISRDIEFFKRYP